MTAGKLPCFLAGGPEFAYHQQRRFIMVATGKGASVGVLFKNAEAIELLRKIDTLVVDKTGTLTEGKPKLVSVVPSGTSEEQLLVLAG